MVSVYAILYVVHQVTRYVNVINTCTLVIGMVGNITACTVILCSKSLYNLTGFYLLSLSTSDLLILMGVLYTDFFYKYESLRFDQVGQYIGEWILQTSVVASTLTVTAFTVERYLAICHPFFVRSMSKNARVKKIIITIWLISALLALLPVVHIFIEAQIESQHLKQTSENFFQYIVDIWAVLYFFMPMSMMTVMYVLIWLTLKRSSNGKQIASLTDRADTRTLMMFVVIVAVFFFAWGPFYIYKLLITHMVVAKMRFVRFDADFLVLIAKLSLVNLAQQVTYPLSSAFNPLIYLMMSKKFREAFEDLLSKTSRSLVDWLSRLVGRRIKSTTTETTL